MFLFECAVSFKKFFRTEKIQIFGDFHFCAKIPMKRVFVENMRDKSERYSSDVPSDLTVGELREALGGDRVKIVCRGIFLENNEKKAP